MSTLSDQACKDAPLADKGRTRKLADGGGLFLLCTDAAKGWRLRYQNAAGKDALMSLGVYPAVSLTHARLAAAEYRAKLHRGESLTDARRRERTGADLQAKTFGEAAQEYNERRARDGNVDSKTLAHDARGFRHSKKLHRLTFADIDRPALLEVCNVIADSGRRETAKRMSGWLQRVWRFGYDRGYIAKTLPDVTQQGGSLGKSLPVVRQTHRPATVDLKEVGALLRVIPDNWIDWPGITPGVARALILTMRTACRPGNIQRAEWSEFDLDGSWPQHEGKPTWVIPRKKMKMKDESRTDHIVPLSTQAVALLQAQQRLSGQTQWVFPGARSDAIPISNVAMSAALLSLGYRDKQTPHGFRTTFKSLAQDILKADSEVVERQLAHQIGNEQARAYDRSQRLDERRALMQKYSDLLDSLRDGRDYSHLIPKVKA